MPGLFADYVEFSSAATAATAATLDVQASGQSGDAFWRQIGDLSAHVVVAVAAVIYRSIFHQWNSPTQGEWREVVRIEYPPLPLCPKVEV